MEVRRFPRTPALGGVQLWVPWLFLLPGACLAAHHREGGLCLKSKREEEHAIKLIRMSLLTTGILQAVWSSGVLWW